MTSEERRRNRLKKLANILHIEPFAERIHEKVCKNEKVRSEKIEKMIKEYEKTIRTAIEEGEKLPLAPPAAHMYRNRS